VSGVLPHDRAAFCCLVSKRKVEGHGGVGLFTKRGCVDCPVLGSQMTALVVCSRHDEYLGLADLEQSVDNPLLRDTSFFESSSAVLELFSVFDLNLILYSKKNF